MSAKVRPTRATARTRAGSFCRKRRRQRGARPEWVRPYRSAQCKIDSAVRLIQAAMAVVVGFEGNVDRRPVTLSRKLTDGTRWLAAAHLRLLRASAEILEAMECVGRAPVAATDDAPVIVELALERWEAVSAYLRHAIDEVALRQLVVTSGLICGELVAEHPSDSRPRIVLAPRPAPVRAFLRARLPRVADRISALLSRRRRTPRPAALTVPPRTSQGRAPPFSLSAAL